jgi:Spy/CpxP family protein refolding chaperone
MSGTPTMEETLTPAASASRKAVLWIVAVFVLGAALGVVSGYLFAHRVSAAGPGPAPLSDDARRQQKVAQLTKELDLTPDQQSQIDAIFLDTAAKFKAVHKESDAQIETLRQAGRDRVRAVLTAEQQPKFEEFLRKLDEDRKNHPQPPAR